MHEFCSKKVHLLPIFHSATGSRLCGSSFVEPRQDFADASVRNEKLSRDVARSHSHQSKLHNAPAHVIRKRPSVYEHSTKLVDTCLTWIRCFETLY